MRTPRRSFRVGAALTALVVIAASVVTMPSSPSAAPHFSFTRTDYLISVLFTTPYYGVDSVAVGDFDGKNGPDIAVLSTYGAVGNVSILLNNGDGTFGAPTPFPTCYAPRDLVVGQFNPSTDSHLDVAMTCGESEVIGRMLGDGQGNLGPVQTIDVGYLGGAAGTGAWAAIIGMLRLGAMNGPNGQTLVYQAYIAGIPYYFLTLCFLEVRQLEIILDEGGGDVVGGSTTPFCNAHVDDIPGSPTFGNLTDWGPVSGDLVLGEEVAYPGQPVSDEAVSFGNGPQEVAVTAYTPFFASTWSYGARNSGNTGGAVALADVDEDGQNDILMGGDGAIAMYAPGWPIAQGATPTRSFVSIPGIVKMVTADFDLDGHLDIAALGDPDFYDDSELNAAIHRGNGDGTFAAHEAFRTKGSTATGKPQIAVGDFNHDGKPDLVTVGGFADSYVSVLLNTTTVVSTLQPTISKFTPASGVPGTTVTVTGTRLYLASSVTFGGVAGTVLSDTPTAVKVRVPAGAASGTIAVTTQDGTATSGASFTVNPSPVPTVKSFSPLSGVVGATVTISGSGLLGASSVTFGGVAGSIVSYTAAAVKAHVPAGAASGPIAVTTPGGTATSLASFTVKPSPVPIVSHFSPVSGVQGATISISGSGLLGASSVKFGGVAAAIVSNTATAVKAIVPAGAASGPIAVTTPGGTATSAASFTVNASPVPVVSGFTPAAGVPGTKISISGSGLLGASSVKFGGVAAPIVSGTATALKALVPAGAVPGKISVTTPGGTAVSAGTFTPK